jgi:predicted AlkP superfamily phosphohydrolase/phosphomutase
MLCHTVRTIVRAASLLLLVMMSLPAAAQSEGDPSVIILGFDGADPDRARELMEAGKLPNLAALAQEGTFGDLATTNPAESPVSWASFATGKGPGHHGIFDFLRRTPGTYFPEIALARAETTPGPSGAVVFGVRTGVGVLGFFIVFLLVRAFRARGRVATVAGAVVGVAIIVATGPIAAKWIPSELPLPVLNRQGIPFWDHAALAGKRVTAIDIPVTFPAQAEDGVQLTTALGTPDVRQTWGSWYLYSSEQFESEFSETAGTLRTVELQDGSGEAMMRGPRNFMAEGRPEIEIPISFRKLDATHMELSVQGETFTLGIDEWSDFVHVRFQLSPLVKLVATTRFKLLDMEPDWHIYQEPLNFDPHHLPPTVNISYPRQYAGQLADRYGLRETLGWSIATNPLKDEAIDYETFVEDLEFTLENRRRAVFGELERGDWDLFTAVFMFTDRMQHMMYRATDEGHPYYDDELAAKFGDRIDWSYMEMDRIVGEIRERFVDENTLLMVISDHGFHSFRRGVNLNTWLVKNGHMGLKGAGLADAEGNYQRLEDFLDPDGRFFQNVDWSTTDAYCLGLGSIYINLRGREQQGAVRPSEYDRVCQEIIDGLLALRDPQDPERTVVAAVYRRDEIFRGPQSGRAPDLFVGFDSDYRVSWQTSAGGIPPEIFEDNLNNWSGDHCSVAPDQTAGIFFSNRPLPERLRSIIDVGPTALAELGVAVPDDYEGSPLQAAPTGR